MPADTLVADAHRGAATLLRQRLKPPPELTVSEWADLHRMLPSLSAEPGRWRTDRTPYLREIMDAFSDPLIERVVFMKAAQIGGSEALLNVLGYFIDQDPCTILIVQVADGEAAKFSKERVAPMIRECPVLAEKVSTPRAKNSGNTIEAKEFPGGHLGIVGATAPAKLRARFRRVALFDEVDGYPASAGSEGDPIELAVKRTTTYWNRKIGLVSTPTVEGVSRIADAFGESDQRYYHVPCPHCEHYQVLQWEDLRWEKKPNGGRSVHQPDTAHYVCEECGGRIEERHKPRMLSRGRWVADNPESDVAGFHLSALYSPWFTWREMVREFLTAKGNANKLKVFVNTRLGETFKEKGDSPPWQRLYDRREPYTIGTCPEGVIFVTAGVDVQEDRVEASIWGWGYEKESWLFDHRVFEGKPAVVETWEPLTELLHEVFVGHQGAEFPIAALAIDTGHDQGSVVSWARRVGDRRIMLVRGDHWRNWSQMLGLPKKSEVTISGRPYGALLWGVGGALIKQETYGFLELEKPTDGESYPPGYIHLPMIGDEFVQQLVSEDLVTEPNKRTGFPERRWEKRRTRNEALDCRVYARAAAEREGLARLIRPDESAPQTRRQTSDGEGPRKERGGWINRGRGGGRRGSGKWLS